MDFTNLHKMLRAPIVGYADLECLVTPETDVDTSTGVDPDAAKRPRTENQQQQYQTHKAASYFTTFVSTDPNFSLESDPSEAFEYPQREPYIGEDAADKLLNYLTTAADRMHEKLFPPAEMIFTEEDKARYDAETQCHICLKKYEAIKHVVHAHRPEDDLSRCGDCKTNDRIRDLGFTEPVHHTHRKDQKVKDCADCKTNNRSKVRDHCHIEGTFRSAAHLECNLQYSIKSNNWKLPVFFHNLRGYDGHLLLKAVNKKYGRCRVIPTNMEKYLAIQVGRVQFLDSMQFVPKSLDTLVGSMKEEDFVQTKKLFGIPHGPRPSLIHHCHQDHDDIDACEWCMINQGEERIQQTFQKGIFPYDHFDSLDRLSETSLPDRDAFYNRLTDKEISDSDMDHARRVWELQGCHTLRDYHNFYLKCDVALLADFFEKF